MFRGIRDDVVPHTGEEAASCCVSFLPACHSARRHVAWTSIKEDDSPMYPPLRAPHAADLSTIGQGRLTARLMQGLQCVQLVMEHQNIQISTVNKRSTDQPFGWPRRAGQENVVPRMMGNIS